MRAADRAFRVVRYIPAGLCVDSESTVLDLPLAKVRYNVSEPQSAMSAILRPEPGTSKQMWSEK
jgi:hypothetical protein